MSLTTTESMMKAQGLNPGNVALFSRYDLLRQAVESAVKRYCKWELEQTTLTEFYDGTGYRDVPLRRPYVSAVASVFLDQQGAYGQNLSGFPPATQLTAGQDYVIVYDDATVDGPVGKSGILRKYQYTMPVFPSDLLYWRSAGGLSYTQPAWWPVGYGNIKVTYTFGFASGSIPMDLQQAVWTGVSIAANSAKYGFPLSSENLGAHSYSLDLGKPPEFGTVRQLLSRYRDVSVGGGAI